MELLEEGFTEYLTEWARHFAKGFDLAAKFDANLKPAFQERQWTTGGTKYYAILRRRYV